MKNIKKIGAMILVVAMLCAMSVGAFAAEATNAIVSDSANDSDIQINSATVEKKGNILTVTLDYSIENAEAGDQITMLGYIFEGNAATGDAAAFVAGNIRAINQADATEGTISFKLATAGEGYTVNTENNPMMVVKLGSDAADVTKAQAFLVDLTAITESGILGDVDGDEEITMDDAIAIKEFKLNWISELAKPEMADVDRDGEITMDDAIAIKEFKLNWISEFPDLSQN